MCFALLHAAYSMARGTWIDRLVIDQLTVKPAVVLVNLLTPDLAARAEGHRIRAHGGSLSVLNGCEGTEMMLLLIAAFLVYPLPLRWGALGLMLSVVMVYILNQVRIVSLFYAARYDRELFGLLHGMLLPIAMIAAGCLFFLWWAGRGSVGGPSAARPVGTQLS